MYEVVYADQVVDFIRDNVTSKRVYERIDQYRHLLEDYPQAGAHYDPAYPAARPPFPCRSMPVPDTPFVLYYAADHDAQKVHVFHIGFQAANPQTRFER